MNWDIFTNTPPLQHIPQNFQRITISVFKQRRYWKNSGHGPVVGGRGGAQRKNKIKVKKKKEKESKNHYFFVYQTRRFLQSETSNFLVSIKKANESLLAERYKKFSDNFPNSGFSPTFQLHFCILLSWNSYFSPQQVPASPCTANLTGGSRKA